MAKKVLIIDDEDWYMEPILERLEFEGFEFNYQLTASDGYSAFGAEAFDIIIVDMLMPLGELGNETNEEQKIPGLLLINKIRDISSNIPIICYTVLHDFELIQKFDDLSCKYIPKGDDPDELFSMIHRLTQ